MNVYAMIDTVMPAPAGLIVTAVLSGAEAAARRAVLPADRAIAEMAATDAAVGDLTALRMLDDDTLFVRATITARGAVEKVKAGIYKAVLIAVAPDGQVERIALIDNPGAFGKRAGFTAAAALRLNHHGEAKMTTPTLRECIDIVHATMNAPPHQRGQVFDTLAAKMGRGGDLRKAVAPGAPWHPAPPNKTAALRAPWHPARAVQSAEADRAEHQSRMVALSKSAAGAAIGSVTAVEHDQIAAFKAAFAAAPRITRPGFAFGGFKE